MGACGSARAPAPVGPQNPQLLEAGVSQSDDASADVHSRFVAQLRPPHSPEKRHRKTRGGYDLEDDLPLDPALQPYRIFFRGALLGCGLITIPMAVLIWVVVSNGVLYRLYPR